MKTKKQKTKVARSSQKGPNSHLSMALAGMLSVHHVMLAAAFLERGAGVAKNCHHMETISIFCYGLCSAVIFPDAGARFLSASVCALLDLGGHSSRISLSTHPPITEGQLMTVFKVKPEQKSFPVVNMEVLSCKKLI